MSPENNNQDPLGTGETPTQPNMTPQDVQPTQAETPLPQPDPFQSPQQPPAQPAQPVQPTTPAPIAGPGAIDSPPPLTSPMNSSGSGMLKKLILAVVSVVVLIAISVAGYMVYKSMEYSEENKLSSEYIKALQDEDYEVIHKIYDADFAKQVDRYVDLVERIEEISPGSTGFDVNDLDGLREETYKAYFDAAEQEVSIPPGEISRISVLRHDDTKPNYIVSAYKVGDKTYSVVLIYRDSKKPKALLVKEGEYNEIKDFEEDFKQYEEDIKTMKEMIDETEGYIDLAESQQGDFSGQSSQLNLGGALGL